MDFIKGTKHEHNETNKVNPNPDNRPRATTNSYQSKKLQQNNTVTPRVKK